jgi:hypothetical protein
MGTIMSLIIGGLLCTASFGRNLPAIIRFGWTHFFYLLGE